MVVMLVVKMDEFRVIGLIADRNNQFPFRLFVIQCQIQGLLLRFEPRGFAAGSPSCGLAASLNSIGLLSATIRMVIDSAEIGTGCYAFCRARKSSPFGCRGPFHRDILRFRVRSTRHRGDRERACALRPILPARSAHGRSSPRWKTTVPNTYTLKYHAEISVESISFLK